MKTALIFGSSGLIGNHLLGLILADNYYQKVKLFIRSKREITDPRVEVFYNDFKNLENIKKDITGNDCFFCIGTTKKNTPDKNEYRRIEYEVPVKIAEMAKLNSVDSFFYISSIGANPGVSNSYLKNKGQVEGYLVNLKFDRFSILRPSLLLGDRKEFRLGEKIAKFIMKSLSFIFIGNIKKYKPIHAIDVAKALIHISKNDYKIHCYESDKLYDLSKK